MKTLVVGGAGFIGSHLCGALLRQGHECVCLDNLSLGTRKHIEHFITDNKFMFYEADAADVHSLETVFQGMDFDMVFHLAANSDIQSSAKNPDVEYKNTYSTTFTVLSCMRKYDVKRFFFASTSAVYGDKREERLDENTSGLLPISYYGAAKLGSEALISAFTYMNEMRSLIFRFPNVIGPALTHGVIYDFIRKLKADPTKLQILGNGKQTKPYIYVSDLVSAIMKFAFQEKDGVTVYNIGAEGETSVDKIAEIVCDEMGLTETVFEYTGGESGWKGDVPRFQYCLDKVHAEGWRAEYTSDEAVRKTVRENLYCTSIKFAEQVDCRPPIRTFPKASL